MDGMQQPAAKKGSAMLWIALVLGVLFFAIPIGYLVFRGSLAAMMYKPDWQDFSPAGGGFTIQMPKPPTETVKPQETAAGTAMLHYFWADYGTVGGFGAAYITFPDSIEKKALADQFLEAMAKGAIEKSKTRLVSKDSIMLGQYHGLELVSELEDQQDMILVTRIYWVPPNKAYMIILGGTRSGPINADRVKFFDSFRLTP
jgi:hypothetical protein